MRAEFTRAVERVLERDERSLLLTGDLGFKAFEGMSRFGPRFLNAGVAEQNMMGAAAGMALSGLTPWVYSIAPFAVLRCLEQIRNDVCFHDLPVRIVGNGGGWAYGVNGPTHHALEDLGVLKGLPNMNLFFPCAEDQVDAAVALMAELRSPSYLRLAPSPHPAGKPLSEDPKTLTRLYRKGGKLTVIGIGHALPIALAALDASGLEADAFGLARCSFKPFVDGELLASARRTRRVMIVEEHYASGGIGESLKCALPPEITAWHAAAGYRKTALHGSPAHYRRQAGLDPQSVAALLRELAG